MSSGPVPNSIQSPMVSVPISQPPAGPSAPQFISKNLNDQIAFLYEQAQNLHDLFTQFADHHIEPMTLFSGMRQALIRLPTASNKLLGALDMFCMVETKAKLQIVELVKGPQRRRTKARATSASNPFMMLSHHINGERSKVTPSIMTQEGFREGMAASDISNAPTIPYSIQTLQLSYYDIALTAQSERKPITITWQPTSPIEGQLTIPPGEKWVITPDGKIYHSELPPLTADEAQLPFTSNVAHWRDSIASASLLTLDTRQTASSDEPVSTTPPAAAAAPELESSKGKQRAHNEDVTVPASDIHPTTSNSESLHPKAAIPKLRSLKGKKRAREEDPEDEIATPRRQAPNPPLSSHSRPQPQAEPEPLAPPRVRRSKRLNAGDTTKGNVGGMAPRAATTRATVGAHAKSSKSSTKKSKKSKK